ncbi:MAG: arginase family protein, partial [Spirochaetes bacterium]|nr:arginase family protein [Spirochaetota bacterium]
PRPCRFGVRVIDTHSRIRGRPPGMSGQWYLSLDLDALEPAFAPGVSHHEPGGLSTREIIDLVHTCDGELVGADIVEYDPSRDLAKHGLGRGT